MQSITNNQSLSIGYAQAILIITVVLGHYSVRPLDVFWPFIYHMPMFFMLGGVLYKEKPIINSLASTLKKHGLYLLYTYLIIALISILINTVYDSGIGKIFSDNLFETPILAIKSNFHNNSYFLVAWFLFAYMFVTILCRLILQIKSKPILFVIAIIIGYLGMGYVAVLFHQTKNQLFNVMSQVMVGSMMYLIGYVLKDKILALRNIYIPFIATAVLFTLAKMKILYGMGMSWSDYHPEFLLHALSTTLGIMTILVITNNLSDMGKRFNLLSVIGSKSKQIMSYHLLSFFAADLIFYYLDMYDITKAKALSHYVTGQYWYVYVIIGVGLPLLISLLFDYLKSEMAKKKLKRAS
ncbi:MAG: acyltransferase family protein [Kluyvera sp.]|uniref:acyltransferase family protein n=1 Tax=Kluyvera sp. TaxID=1538228 RepID=UPI003F2CF2E6